MSNETDGTVLPEDPTLENFLDEMRQEFVNQGVALMPVLQRYLRAQIASSIQNGGAPLLDKRALLATMTDDELAALMRYNADALQSIADDREEMRAAASDLLETISDRALTYAFAALIGVA